MTVKSRPKARVTLVIHGNSVICRCTPGAHLGHTWGTISGIPRAHLGHTSGTKHTWGTSRAQPPGAHLGHTSGTSRAHLGHNHLGHTWGTPRAHLGHKHLRHGHSGNMNYNWATIIMILLVWNTLRKLRIILCEGRDPDVVSNPNKQYEL